MIGFINWDFRKGIRAILAIQKKRGFVDDQEVDYQVRHSIIDGSHIDLDGGTTQLIMSGTMEDGKPRTDIYAYQGGEATLAGQIDAKDLEIMEGCFWAYQYDEQQTQLERSEYLYENGTVVETGVTESVETESVEMGGGQRQAWG